MTTNEDLLKSLDKKFGKGKVMLLNSEPLPFESFSSGNIEIDRILGGGWAKKRISEVFGPESSGKTTLAIMAIAQAQKIGMKTAFIDMEHAFDPLYAGNLGVNLDAMLITQPDYGEEALQIAEELMKSGVNFIVIDSVATLIPLAELEGEMGESKMGLHARLMAQACRKLNGLLVKYDSTIMFINQLRDKIGVVYGNPETTTGGKSLAYYCSQRVEVRKSTKIESGGEVVGNEVNIKCIKNKVAPPYKKTKIPVFYGKGFVEEYSIAEAALELGIIKMAGAWVKWSETGETLCQGKEALVSLLKDNPELKEEILNRINK